MDDILPALLPGRIILVVASARTARKIMTDAAARLALAGPLEVIDGGNCFDAYGTARALRRLTPQLAAALQRIHLARAFTCYQLTALITHMPASDHPRLVLDFLNTFYDDSVSLPESLRLLTECIRHIHRLSRPAPMLMGIRPPRQEQPERQPLFDRLRDIGDMVLIFDNQPPQQSLRLF